MDFLVERRVGVGAVRSALAEIFRAPPDDLDVAWLKDLIRNPSGPARPIHAEVVRTRGDFRTLVKVDVAPQYATSDHVSFARRMSSLLGSSLLVPLPDPDPYSYLLIRKSGEVSRVDLDPESIDEHGEYRLAKL